MANYDILKESIAAVIKENGNQEITGNLLQQTLFAMVNALGTGYQFAGVASQAVIPGTPDAKLFYIAAGPGTYENFNNLVVNPGEIAVFFQPEGYSAWYKQSVTIDVSNKADKVADATEGDVASLDSSGNLRDSGIAATDVKNLIINTYTFNHIEVASGGKITFDAITLSQDGDELEIEALPDTTVDNQGHGGYAFTFGSTEGAIRVGLSTQQVCFRTDDNTWVYGPTGTTGDATSYNPKKVKIKYTGGNIEVYTNDVLRTTYTGQKTATIKGIGSQTMTDYGKWFGKIYKFNYTHNGVTTALMDLPNFSYNSDVTIIYDITLARVPKLEAEMATVLSAGFPKFAIRSTSSQVKVYTHLHGDLYAWFGINHIVNTSDTYYGDYWRIGDPSTMNTVSGLATYENGIFTPLAGNPHLLNLAENEFAIQFWSGDFTGGAHGDERIDLEAGCYVVFIVDGQEYSITDLIALGDINCTSFGYREKSALYTRYEDTGTHDVIAYHTKRTDFCAGGYKTRNYVEMTAALTAKTTYTGLFCVAASFSDYLVNDAGTIFAAAHPTTSVQISGFNNKASREVKMYKDNASCVMNSKVIGGNVSAFNSAGVSIQAWDRQNDCKYYSRMPSDTALAATSVFEFEADIVFDYKA